MTAAKVWTFFYGSFINLDVLAKVGLVPERHEVARLAGFDITIRPLANPVRSDQHVVYGIVAAATHDELRRLYAYAEHDPSLRFTAAWGRGGERALLHVRPPSPGCSERAASYCFFFLPPKNP